MLFISILDCLFGLDAVEPEAFVGVVFAGEDFAAGEKLILVWRFGALVRLRPIAQALFAVRVNVLQSCASYPLLCARRVDAIQSSLAEICSAPKISSCMPKIGKE